MLALRALFAHAADPRANADVAGLVAAHADVRALPVDLVHLLGPGRFEAARARGFGLPEELKTDEVRLCVFFGLVGVLMY